MGISCRCMLVKSALANGFDLEEEQVHCLMIIVFPDFSTILIS